MTISPPLNVRLAKDDDNDSDDKSPRVLSCGVDTLQLSIDIVWENEDFFNELEVLKSTAERYEKQEVGYVKINDTMPLWVYCMQPFGAKGYAWILSNPHFNLKIGNWIMPQQRPSVMVEIRSQALWTYGVDRMVQYILSVIKAKSGNIRMVKLSRVDLCVDILLTENLWLPNLRSCFNTRAKKIDPHFSHDQLTGFNIGRGSISARLYDKPLEIKEKSNKTWMFDIWGLESVPAGHRIIRVEFQMRRQYLVEVGVNEYHQLENALPSLWRTCTTKWLKLVVDKTKHPSRQKLLFWWQVIQCGFAHSQEANLLVRAKEISRDRMYLERQLLSAVAGLVAYDRGQNLIAIDEVLDMKSHVLLMIRNTVMRDLDDEKFTQKVRLAQAKKLSQLNKFEKVTRLRQPELLFLDKDHSSSPTPPVLGEPSP